jgi:hypothetical protein
MGAAAAESIALRAEEVVKMPPFAASGKRRKMCKHNLPNAVLIINNF